MANFKIGIFGPAGHRDRGYRGVMRGGHIAVRGERGGRRGHQNTGSQSTVEYIRYIRICKWKKFILKGRCESGLGNMTYAVQMQSTGGYLVCTPVACGLTFLRRLWQNLIAASVERKLECIFLFPCVQMY